MDILVGATGFVGSNLCLQKKFDGLYHSKNISAAYGLRPDLCVYAGVRAEKFLANKQPEADFENICAAIANISQIAPRRLVLISTIDVYQNSLGADETTPAGADGLHPYGRHRLHLERWAQENVPCCHILRLPALYGKNLKKNFLYDLIHVVPSLLTEEKHAWFSQKSPLVGKAYENQGNGFYRCAATSPSDLAFLKEFFTREGFTALSFTDSRAVFQFYGLHYLWGHIKFATENEIPLLNLATEPVSAGEIYAAAKGGAFENEICDRPPVYGFKTIYANCLGGKNGYIFDKQRVLGDILTFLEETTC